MPKASELISKLAKDAGIEQDNEALKAVLSDPKLSEVDLPDDFTGAITSKLMTLDSAKNNPDIAKAFKGQYLGTVNRDVEKFLKDNELPDEVIEQVQAESDSLARLRAAMKVYAEHKENTYKEQYLKNAPDAEKFKQREDELSNMVNKLKGEVALKDNEKANLRKELEQQFEQERVNWSINQQLAGYEFSDSIPKDDARLLINAKLSTLPYVFRKGTDGQIGVYQKDDPSLVAFEDNKELTVKDVLDKIAAPYLKKHEAPKEEQRRRFEPPKTKNGRSFGGHAQKVKL